MKIYLDNCALGRLFDKQDQPRVITEARAVTEVLRRVSIGSETWIASPVLHQEIARNPNLLRRSATLQLLEAATTVQVDQRSLEIRSAEFADRGLKLFDARHLAFAEAAHVDVLLTTDDRFVRASARIAQSLPSQDRLPAIANPVDWLRRLTS